jgi:hypothetical protein
MSSLLNCEPFLISLVSVLLVTMNALSFLEIVKVALTLLLLLLPVKISGALVFYASLWLWLTFIRCAQDVEESPQSRRHCQCGG